MKVDPKEMFLKEERYVKFDESGIPTHEKGKQGEK